MTPWIAFLMLSAPAPDLSADDLEDLANREAVVSVDAAEQRTAARIHGVIDIAATPETVWEVMQDCPNAPDYVPGLESCTVLESDPNARQEVWEHVLNFGWLAPETRSEFLLTYLRPESITFSKTGGDFEVMEGMYQLSIPAPGTTRVTYTAEIWVEVPVVPDFVIRNAMAGDTEDILEALRDQAETVAKARVAEAN